MVTDDQPALWTLEQDYTGPDGLGAYAPRLLCARADGGLRAPTASGPHERTHPGPKEDRLRLTRATKDQPLPHLLACTPIPAGDGRRCALEASAVRRRRVGPRPPMTTAPVNRLRPDHRPGSDRRPFSATSGRHRAADRRRTPSV